MHAVIAQLVHDVGYNCRRGNAIYQVSTVLLAMVTVAKYQPQELNYIEITFTIYKVTGVIKLMYNLRITVIYYYKSVQVYIS